MRDAPAVNGARQPILVTTRDDVVGTPFGHLPNVLCLEIAPVRCSVTVDGYFVIADQMLTVVEMLEGSTDPANDGVDASERRRPTELRSCVIEEHRTEGRPVLRVERSTVSMGDGDDVTLIEQQLECGVHVGDATT